MSFFQNHSGWPLVPLKNIATLKRGYDLPVGMRNAGVVPIYAANGKNGAHDEEKVQGPGVITGRSGTIGKVHYCEEGFWPLNTALYVMDFHGNYPRWVYYMLSAFKLERFSEGAGVPTLNRNLVHDELIPLPPLSEQKRIAAILDKADAIRRKRQKATQLADDFLRAVFLDMFGDPVTNPKGWEVTFMASHGTFKNGLNFGKGESGSFVRYLGVGDFKSLTSIDAMQSLGVIELNNNPAKGYLLKNGDLVFVRSNGNRALVGRCITVYPDNEKLTFSGFCIRYRVEDGCVEPEYLNYLFRTPSMKRAMLKGGQGANIQNINQKILSALNIPLPPVDLQKRFCRVIKVFKDSMLRFDAIDTDSDTLFRAISQKAFSGKL